MSVTFTDNSAAWTAALDAGANDGLTAMASFYAGAFAQNIGSEGGGVIANTKFGPYYRSSPRGSFPGVRKGSLKGSMVSTKAEGLVAYAGSTLKRAAWLETGWERRKRLTEKQIRFLHALRRELEKTGVAVMWEKGARGGKVWARPWLRRTVREQKAAAGFVFQTTAADSIAKRIAK